jgi:hypothetical protein
MKAYKIIDCGETVAFFRTEGEALMAMQINMFFFTSQIKEVEVTKNIIFNELDVEDVKHYIERHQKLIKKLSQIKEIVGSVI